MAAHLATTSGLPTVVRLTTSAPEAVFSTYFQSGPQMYLYPSDALTSAAEIPATVTVNTGILTREDLAQADQVFDSMEELLEYLKQQ